MPHLRPCKLQMALIAAYAALGLHDLLQTAAKSFSKSDG